jgi:ATP-dependent Clp protease adaptor protein ClpS
VLRREPVKLGSTKRIGFSNSLRCSVGTAKRGRICDVPAPSPVQTEEPITDTTVSPDRPWVVLVWNDPINLMSYVTFVLQKVFGYSKEKAEKMMWDVHTKGRAVVSNGTREKAEMDVYRLHEHGLWATMQQDDAS